MHLFNINSSFISTFSLAEMESSRRRSLRKREEKSYVESPDLIFEEEGSSHKRGALGGSGLKTVASVISNGDVEMESDDDDEPLDPLPLPKVRDPELENKALIQWKWTKSWPLKQDLVVV